MEKYSLGKRAPIDRKSVKFKDFLTSLPVYPLVDFTPQYNFPMDGNDKVGCCVVAGWDHFRQIVTGLLTGTQQNFTQDEIWAFYKTQNPNFDLNSPTNGAGSSSDNGMNIQLFLEYLVSQKKILAFASVDYTNIEELKSATYIGLGLITGVVLQQSQMQQFANGTWDYVESPVEGGHCIPLSGYRTDMECVTWAKIVTCTSNFISKQMDEAWFVLMQEHIDHPDFRNHFDLEGFANAVSQITDGKVIVPITKRVLRLASPMMRGSDVMELQNNLIGLGYSLGKADGIFGKMTKGAVMSFQKDHNLMVDGIVGKMTWQAFDMIKIITDICTTNGVEPALGVAVASCESNLNPKATLYNKPSKSTDRGLFQWNNVYHPEITDDVAFDPNKATLLFCNAVKNGQLKGYWKASMFCWIKKISNDIKIKYHLV